MLWHLFRGGIFGAIALAVLCADVMAQDSVERSLVVRLYDTFGVHRADMAAAERQADTIFHDAGLLVAWRECGMPRGSSARSIDRCTEVPAATELIVRIIAAPKRAAADDNALGYSLVDPALGAGRLATVFGDRVTKLAARVHISRATLVGRTLAHEIGHLLLGTTDHADAGIMQGHWSNQFLRSTHSANWQFSDPQRRQVALALQRHVPAQSRVATVMPLISDREAATR